MSSTESNSSSSLSKRAEEKQRKDAEQQLEITELQLLRGEGKYGDRLFISGRLAAYDFSAHMYAKGEPIPGWGIGKSGVVMMIVRRLADDRLVYHWDRGKVEVSDFRSLENSRLVKESPAHRIADYLSSDRLNEACERYLKSRKEIVRISPEILEQLARKNEAAAGKEMPSEARRVEQKKDDFAWLKRHWNEALSALEKMENAHGGKVQPTPADEVERFRKELDSRLLDVVQKREPKPRFGLG